MLKKVVTGIVLCLLLPCAMLWAHTHKSDKMPVTEGQLVDTILACMRYQDTITYAALFDPFDSVWEQIIKYQPQTEDENKEMAYLRQHPEHIQKFAPAYNPDIVKNYYYVLKKGRDSGIHWNQIALLRYELNKERLTRDLIGFEHIADVRFQGFVFVKDMLTRRTYAFTIREMQHIQGQWYGGQVLNIYEAANQDEYWAKQAGEMKQIRMMKEFGLTPEDLAKAKDTQKDSEDADADKEEPNATTAAKSRQNDILAVNTDIYGGDNPDDNAKKEAPKLDISNMEVVDRKLFEGTFDNHIPVRLYIRYLKGGCPEGICAWEAIYKFGDQDKYIKLDVSKSKDGKWEFLEDPPIGDMELIFKNGMFTGNWLSTDIKTGYDVKLHEVPLTPKEAKQLDKIIQTGDWAKDRNEDAEKRDEQIKPINAGITNGVY